MSRSATAAPDEITYMDTAAAVSPRVALDYKRLLLTSLRIGPGHTVADIGCGPGTDLPALLATGATTVIGVDRSPAMAAEARHRAPSADIRVGDAHALPIPSSSVDRLRTDRVLQHVTEPAAAIAEAFRVLRPGGILGMAEPDWDTLAVAADDVETSRGFARFTAGQVRNATLGRQLTRLTARCGFEPAEVMPVPVVFRDFTTADLILGLTRNCARAVEAHQLREEVAAAWLEALAEPSTPFLASVTLFVVTATRPAGSVA